MPSFSPTSESHLDTCDMRLQHLFETVVRGWDCTVGVGHRSKDAQNEAYKDGFSKVEWPDSHHNVSPSLAVDVMHYPIDWNDIQRVKNFANFVKGVALGKGIAVRWGGDFKNFFDGAHWQVEKL